MAALNGRGLPVPAIPAVSSEPVIDGRPFVLMEEIDGERIELVGPREKPLEIAASAVEVLQRLHAVPVAATGIGEEDPMPLAGEMMRWAWLMERAAPDLTGRAGELGLLLAEKVPAEKAPTLVHGDYHMGNLLFHGPRVAAVLDWEIAQIGQPLLDLACLCVMVARKRFEGGTAPGGTRSMVTIARAASIPDSSYCSARNVCLPVSSFMSLSRLHLPSPSATSLENG
jgi:aminoglycoside phosphotransferase (APT) family kinase protein